MFIKGEKKTSPENIKKRQIPPNATKRIQKFSISLKNEKLQQSLSKWFHE